MQRVCWTFILHLLLGSASFSQTIGLDFLVTVSFENSDPDIALRLIEQASGLPFSYNNKILPNQNVSGSFEAAPLREVLSQVLGSLGLTYTYRKGFIILIPGNKRPRIIPSFTISGYVEDNFSGERLIGAAVYDASSRSGVITNEFGFFSLQVPKDSVKLVISMVGYALYAEMLYPEQDVKGIVRLKPDLSLETVEIIDQQNNTYSELGGISAYRIPISDLRALPALMGETDVLAGLSLLPGVNSSSDGASGLYVRGGGPDQNLILFDGVPIYNSSHLFGFYSIFNSDAIKDVKLVKGGFPARYGGRLSSVVSIRMNEGNLNEWSGQGNVGLTSGRLLLHGPLVKDKLSLTISGRRTLLEPYLAIVSKIAQSNNGNSIGYSFHDFQGKVCWIASERDGIYLSGYTGGDVFSSGFYIDTNGVIDALDFNLRWGNTAGILRWHRDWSKELFSDFSVFTTRYKYHSLSKTEVDFPNEPLEQNELTNRSRVKDFGIRLNFDYIPANKQVVRMGATVIQHEFTPEILQRQSFISGSNDEISQDVLRPLEANIYFEDQVQATEKISFNLGLHTSYYLLDTFSCTSIQPRASFRIGPTDRWGVYGSYSTMTQYLHLLSNSGTGLPIDLWVPATEIVQPEFARQVSLGVDKTFHNPTIQFSVEAYRKQMENLIDYQTGANFLGNANWQEKVEKGGTGESYGLEVFLRKPKGTFKGWVGYTWSKTTRQFPTINNNEPYPYKYDRRHDFSAVAICNLNDKIQFSANFVFGTGTANTLPVAVSLIPSNPAFSFLELNEGSSGTNVTIEYGKRNAFTLPPYHRLDFNVRVAKTKPWGETYWNFGLYNAYNRRNPYFLFLRADYSNNIDKPVIKARKLSLLPVLPSINWGFKF